jgi:hypothetical protein
MIRRLFIGRGIRSERRLCQDVHLNLAYRWFCRLGLNDVVSDHSTFSSNRHGRFRDADLLREVFESVAFAAAGNQPLASAISATSLGRLAGPFANTKPYTASCPRNALMCCVRCRTSRSRLRKIAALA